MLTNESILYLGSITYNHYQKDFWESIRQESGTGGKFMLDLSNLYSLRDLLVEMVIGR
jgi:hypothetical protein